MLLLTRNQFERDRAERTVLKKTQEISFQISVQARIIFSACYVLLIVTFSLMQIGIGGWGVTLFVLVLVSMTSLLPLMFRFWCAADFLWLAFSAYNGILALAIKSFLQQPVQSNLVAPVEASTYLIIGVCSAAFGYLLARIVARPSQAPFKMTERGKDPIFLRRFATPIFVIGFCAFAAHAILRPRFEVGQAGEGFGGLGVLSQLCILGLAFQTLRWRQGSGGLAGFTLLLMLTALTFLGILNNVKKPIIDGLTLVGLTLLTQPGRLPIVKLLLAATPIPVLLFYVAPLIQIMRPQLKAFNVSEIMEVGAKVLQEADYDPSKLSAQVDLLYQGNAYSFRTNSTYLFPSSLNADRFALIMPIDQVARLLPSRGIMGLRSLSDVPESYLPGFLYSKSGVASTDLIAWYYMIRSDQVISRPVIGLIASSMALGGMPAVIFLPFLVIFAYYSIINLLSGPIGSSAWPMFVVSVCLLSAEQELSAIINNGARVLPLVGGLGFSLNFLSRYIFTNRSHARR